VIVGLVGRIKKCEQDLIYFYNGRVFYSQLGEPIIIDEDNIPRDAEVSTRVEIDNEVLGCYEAIAEIIKCGVSELVTTILKRAAGKKWFIARILHSEFKVPWRKAWVIAGQLAGDLEKTNNPPEWYVEWRLKHKM